MKINIKKIETIDKNDLLKRVEYRYSIGDSSGILKIEQSMYNDINELRYFIESIIPNLYKFKTPSLYIYYYKNYKYSLYPNGYIGSYRMY